MAREGVDTAGLRCRPGRGVDPQPDFSARRPARAVGPRLPRARSDQKQWARGTVWWTRGEVKKRSWPRSDGGRDLSAGPLRRLSRGSRTGAEWPDRRDDVVLCCRMFGSASVHTREAIGAARRGQSGVLVRGRGAAHARRGDALAGGGVDQKFKTESLIITETAYKSTWAPPSLEQVRPAPPW